MRRTRSEVVGRAVRTAIRNPGRSILTMLGLAIGVGAFIAMVSFGTGARTSVMQQFEILGTRIVYVWGNMRRRNFSGSSKPLSDADVEALRRDGMTIERVVPRITEVHAVTSTYATYSTKVTGTMPGFVDIREWPMLMGGMFDDTDVQQRAKVAVIGTTTARELFRGADPIGQTITIGSNLPCRIIGVLVSKGERTTGEDMDDNILIPATTYEAFIGMPIGYHELMVQVRDIELLETAMLEFVPIMRRSHRLSDAEPDDFRLGSPAQQCRGREIRLQHSNRFVGVNRRRVAPGRRHRGNEHSTGVGRRAYQRDRCSLGDRCIPEADPGAVSVGGRSALVYGIDDRRVYRMACVVLDGTSYGLVERSVRADDGRRGRVRYQCRCGLWVPPGPARSAARAHRGAAP